MRRSKSEIAKIVDALDYDFSYFSIENFVEHIERYRQRPIFVSAIDLDGTDTGVRIKLADRDLVAYAEDVHPVHRIHIILHELGHIIMNHPGKALNISALRDMASAEQPVLMGQVRSLDPRNKDADDLDIEWEAEQFVYEVRKRIQRAHRMNELIKPLSSNVKLAEISEALFFDELR